MAFPGTSVEPVLIDLRSSGPREISIADPEAVKIIYGSQAPVSKGPWYTLLEPRVPLFMARDKQEHARRRKVWDQGFTTKGKDSPSLSQGSTATDTPTALQGYDSRITRAITLLLAAVERHEGRPMDVAEWFSFFVFDVMEDLAFNKSSKMLANGKAAYIFQTIRTDMYNIAFFTHLPWLLPFLKRTPILNWNYIEFLDWIQKLIDERKLVSPALSTLPPNQRPEDKTHPPPHRKNPTNRTSSPTSSKPTPPSPPKPNATTGTSTATPNSSSSREATASRPPSLTPSSTSPGTPSSSSASKPPSTPSPPSTTTTSSQSTSSTRS